MNIKLLVVTGALLALSHTAYANQLVTYNLVDVTFNGYGPATGYFTWDWTIDKAVDCSIIDGGGRFYLGGLYPAKVTKSSIDGSYDYQNVSYDIALVFDRGITPSSGALIDPTQSFFTVDLSGNGGGVTTYKSTGGSIVPVPEPPSLGMLLTPLAVCLRRRRQSAAR